jgi:outer membrane protein TolC
MRKYFLLSLAVLMFGWPGAGLAAAEPEAAQAQRGDGVIRVRLEKLIHEVAQRNAGVISDYLQAKMSQERIRAEEGIFEPLFQTSLNKSRVHVPNSTEDILTRQQNEYNEDVLSWDMGIGGMISTGANWELKFTDRQRNSATIAKFRNYNYEYDDLLKLSLGQPLLKGFGSDVAKAKINMAKVQSDIDENKYEQKMMELVAMTIQLYWKLYGVQQIRGTWERSLVIAEDAVKDMERRSVGGKIPQTELMEAQSTITTRRAELHSASARVVEVRNQLLTLMNVSVSDFGKVNLVAVDDPFGIEDVIGNDDPVQRALARWPEYKIARKNVEKEKIQVLYAENQFMPQLDLVGSVSYNSLDQEHRQALRDVLKDEFVSWSAGLKFSVPLLDRTQAKSSLTVARMRAKQADVELASLEKSLANSIHTKIASLQSLREQLREYEKGLKIREQLLEIEQVRLRHGHISLKSLLDQEAEHVDFQRKVLSAVVNYKLAEATFEIAMGTILEKYGVNPAEIRQADRFSHHETVLKEPQPLEKEHLEAATAGGEARP